MSTLTPNYKLEKPESTDYYDVNVQNRNWEKIDSELKDIDDKKADLGEDGKILSEQLPPMNYDPAGSAAAVQKNLDAHTSNKKNPHGVTADQVGADPKGSANAVKQSLEAHTGNKQNPHGVTAAQVGAYSKEQALSSATAALFGLGSDAVPNDVFEQLGNLANYHIWRKSTTTKPAGYELMNKFQTILYSSTSSRSDTDFVLYLSVSDEIEVDQDGFVTQVNIGRVTVYGGLSESALQTQLAGKFVRYISSGSEVTEHLSSDVWYYFPENVQISKSSHSFTIETCGIVNPYAATIGDEYVFSADSDAYPSDGEEFDGSTFTYLGRLGDKARIVMGRYAGTGLYGIDNPNTIVFSSAPKLVVITGNDLNHNTFILLYTGGDTSFSGYTSGSVGDTYQIIVDKSKSFTWYGNSRTQMNSLGAIYTYTAVL